jgi:hypothetical protein
VSSAGNAAEVKVLFITGLSHSGSTLLDVLLNAHPEVTSVGELKQLGRFARYQKNGLHQCTCGAESLWSCPLWSQVNARTEAAVGRSLSELNVENYADVEGFNSDNATLFKAISEAAGKNYVVDSSKHRDRLNLLIANPALDVFPIFVLRNPKGQICSSLRKKQIDLSELIYRYVATNRDIYNLIRRVPHGVVHYEQLVSEPEQTLGTLMRQIGLEYDPGQLDWANEVRHNAGGNRMRWQGTSELKLDDAWREKLTFPQKLAIDAGTIAGRYPFIGLGPHGAAR